MNHLLQAVQLYVLGRRASFDFQFGDCLSLLSRANAGPIPCPGVVVDGNSDGLVGK